MLLTELTSVQDICILLLHFLSIPIENEISMVQKLPKTGHICTGVLNWVGFTELLETPVINIFLLSWPAFTCLMLTIQTQEPGVKYVQI